jgi:hypothetical protein
VHGVDAQLVHRLAYADVGNHGQCGRRRQHLAVAGGLAVEDVDVAADDVVDVDAGHLLAEVLRLVLQDLVEGVVREG